ncbi:1-deoxy-D-xylulose-5-phosphate reductoisomerase [Tenuibacillus multivorans]|uniref:1-deoxy-D-xylulose 5-phosphate reductoisomerase n=1 Tax=Tenuibacillus multivorans TaxID=237069 RepID=A0A1G9XWD1_9BACI|nr:1-deoxy-D-xylulose-5-phosphate reductoisomerase [Tenuibacillus multivorans]GEL75843.1 1-deoxy-D-xylulose 5-phosphate reductoisomerase [Tenuibacillus multivorans]SDN01060.1 1-deoxy-D-xylulose-5-phosphate reductoisomerase [Tenuibacillus multivorans]
MKKIALLGGTGSIGVQTIDVIKEHPEQFELYAFAFGSNIEQALPIIENLKPKFIVVKNHAIKDKLSNKMSYNASISYGVEAINEMVSLPEIDIVVNAVLGSVGLQPTLQAIRSGKSIAFANKETLVTAGHLVMKEANAHQVELLPVDSEHAAIHQSLKGEQRNEIKRILLTASGGSFRDKTRNELVGVTKQDALKHPNWSMGAKITIDSATMMNKGLEVIEAHWLFDVPYDKIEVIMHEESVIHSMVEYLDRSVMAQLGTPDMRIPIQYALTYPNRFPYQLSDSLDLAEIGTLHFREMSFERYPCLKMAYEAGRIGGSLPTVLNAANEEAVALFLDDQITFLEIEQLIELQLEKHETVKDPDLETIITIDEEIRRNVRRDVLKR